MAEANGNGLRPYLPYVTAFIALGSLLVFGGRLLNRVDNLEDAVKDRAAGLQQHMDNLADAANSRWQARDRQAEAGDQRIRALAEALIALSRDVVGAASIDARQDETIKQNQARMERLLERYNELERELRPYQLPQQR